MKRLVLGYVVAGVAAIVAVVVGAIGLVFSAVDDSGQDTRTAVVVDEPACTQDVDPATGTPRLDCSTEVELDGDSSAVASGSTLEVGDEVEVVVDADGRPLRVAELGTSRGPLVIAAVFAVVAVAGLVVARTGRATSSPRS